MAALRRVSRGPFAIVSAKVKHESRFHRLDSIQRVFLTYLALVFSRISRDISSPMILTSLNVAARIRNALYTVEMYISLEFRFFSFYLFLSRGREFRDN